MTNSPALMLRSLSDTEIDEVDRLTGRCNEAVSAEIARRAEIRLVRRLSSHLDEGMEHEAAWYEPRSVRSCDDCGHAAHDERVYQRCSFNVGLGECNCQNVPAYDFEEAYA